jgi:hypothetical protein
LIARSEKKKKKQQKKNPQISIFGFQSLAINIQG